MRVVQFEVPGTGRHLGVVQDDAVVDITSAVPQCQRVVDAFAVAYESGASLDDVLSDFASRSSKRHDYAKLLATEPGSASPYLLPPVDDADPRRVLITGTGLTHTGSMQSRDAMHSAENEATQAATDEPQTDSARMFAMGLKGGRPASGQRGVSPEWFYKGNGTVLRGPRAKLELPEFALDGGEEPELVGCYIVDPAGRPRRLGFALGNEWSDHETERINYLYLAPSKLRTCAVGPELVTDFAFDELTLRCTVQRDGETIYDSGELKSGEKFMCHSLANCEDHHFKYPQHRVPGDVHLHFFGTSKLSFSERDWKYQPGDEIRIEAEGFGGTLVNVVAAGDGEASTPVLVAKA